VSFLSDTRKCRSEKCNACITYSALYITLCQAMITSISTKCFNTCRTATADEGNAKCNETTAQNGPQSPAATFLQPLPRNAKSPRKQGLSRESLSLYEIVYIHTDDPDGNRTPRVFLGKYRGSHPRRRTIRRTLRRFGPNRVRLGRDHPSMAGPVPIEPAGHPGIGANRGR